MAISGTPAIWASVTVITTVETSGTCPPGMLMPTRRIGSYFSPTCAPWRLRPVQPRGSVRRLEDSTFVRAARNAARSEDDRASPACDSSAGATRNFPGVSLAPSMRAAQSDHSSVAAFANIGQDGCHRLPEFARGRGRAAKRGELGKRSCGNCDEADAWKGRPLCGPPPGVKAFGAGNGPEGVVPVFNRPVTGAISGWRELRRLRRSFRSVRCRH